MKDDVLDLLGNDKLFRDWDARFSTFGNFKDGHDRARGQEVPWCKD